LNEAVRRNLAKFPTDFMFQPPADEWAALRSHASANKGALRGRHRKHLPFAFTDPGPTPSRHIKTSGALGIRWMYTVLKYGVAKLDSELRPKHSERSN
jgi:ORF6N domain